ncbi:hypothetical protein [uncultured Rossellomorea sp.]|uniref:hypothetical protein n=1 Tax=uncultured Rossellomorea sp. TaxID=2837549 RepID=UPI00262AE16D|nr:hypothetical protein [uncultured Rossellomorea sp.]
MPKSRKPSVCTIRQTTDGTDFSIPCDGSTRTFFRSITDTIHNEVSVDIQNRSETDDCVMTLVIERRDGSIITKVIQPPQPSETSNGYSIYDQDVVSISVRCEGNPANSCDGFIIFNSFSCFCLECGFRKCEAKTDNHLSDTGCMTLPLTTFARFNQPCDGELRTILDNLSDRNSMTRVTIQNLTPECEMTAIIEANDGTQIERSVIFTLSFNLSVEDIRKVSIRCEGEPNGVCEGTVTSEKRSCLCCNERVLKD